MMAQGVNARLCQDKLVLEDNSEPVQLGHTLAMDFTIIMMITVIIKIKIKKL